jgi:hypothetical protein
MDLAFMEVMSARFRPTAKQASALRHLARPASKARSPVATPNREGCDKLRDISMRRSPLAARIIPDRWRRLSSKG